MNFFEYSSNRPSTRCSSRLVPSTTVIRACVSPRWNIGRAVDARQDVDFAFDRANRRVIATVGTTAGEDQIANDALFEARPGAGEAPATVSAPAAVGSGMIAARAWAFTASTASARACLPSVALALA